MKYVENILEVSQLLPDYLGFIFYEKSARYFDGEIPEIPKSIKKVGVFVNASFEEILEKAEKHQLNLIQLHGSESPKFCQKLKIINLQIIKVFSVDSDFDFSILNNYENVCDYFLFDTKGKLPGGNGFAFDWNLLSKYNLQKPFFLSGGIGIDEIPKIKTMNLPIFAIDVNSKFEIQAGLKNVNMCELAIEIIR